MFRRPSFGRRRARVGAQEWAGPLVCVRRDSAGWLFDQVTVTRLTSDRVDIILPPSHAAAARTIDTDEMWGDEVVFRDVPLR